MIGGSLPIVSRRQSDSESPILRPSRPSRMKPSQPSPPALHPQNSASAGESGGKHSSGQGEDETRGKGDGAMSADSAQVGPLVQTVATPAEPVRPPQARSSLQPPRAGSIEISRVENEDEVSRRKV